MAATWSVMEMAGEPATLCRLAGFSDHLEPARLTLELIRLVHREQGTRGVPDDTARQSVLAYLSTIDAFTRVAASLRSPALSGAASPAAVREMRPVMALLGIGFDPKSATHWHDLPRGQDAARRMLSDAGLDLENLAARLNRGERLSLTLPRTRLPLPLTPRTWRQVVFRGKVPDASLFPAIIRDRTAALLYHALASLDEETLGFLGSHPGLLSAMKDRPGTFAATARSIHVQGGRVLVPGGVAAEPLWSELVAARADQPERFVGALVRPAGGALAYFYDAVAHLEPGVQRFALGLVSGASTPEAARFARLYRSFTAGLSAWQVETHPFTRPIGDGLSLFAQLQTDGDGRLAMPNSVALWQCAFAAPAVPTDEELRTQAVAAQPAADAAAIAETVLAPSHGLQRRMRARTVWFAQRVFGATTPADAPSVCAVLRAFPRFEALALVLERIGIDEPRVYLRAMRRASSLSALAAPSRTTALSEFQGALALVDRLAMRETLDAALARHLVESLVAVPLVEDGYRGGTAAWLDGELIPALRARMPQSAATTDEDLVLEALAGMVPVVAAPPTTIQWEGQSYRLEPASSEMARLLRVRHKQAGSRLDEPLALGRIATQLGRQGVGRHDARRLAAELAGLLKQSAFADGNDGDGASQGRQIDKLREAVARFEASPDSEARRMALAERTARMSDVGLARVLRSLAYAAAIGSPDSNLFLGSDVALDHDFGFADSDWAIAGEQSGSGMAWHLRGSLLALDVPLARYSLRRISSDLPAGAPRLDPSDERALAHTASLQAPWSLTDDVRDRLVSLVERGRQEAAAANSRGALAAVFDAANINEWRRNELAWQVAREGVRLDDALTLTELLWVGARRDRVLPPDAWGTSMIAVSGCLCRRFRGPGAIETLGWQTTGGLLSSYLADPILRVAQLTADTKLPAALIPMLLPAITADTIDGAQLADAVDWPELARAARAVPRERFEDQVAALTVAGGPLVPAAGTR